MPGMGRYLAFDVLSSRPRRDAADWPDGQPNGVRTWQRAIRTIGISWQKWSGGQARNHVPEKYGPTLPGISVLPMCQPTP